MFNLDTWVAVIVPVVAPVVAITTFPPTIPLPPIEIAPPPIFANEALTKGAPVNLLITAPVVAVFPKIPVLATATAIAGALAYAIPPDTIAVVAIAAHFFGFSAT